MRNLLDRTLAHQTVGLSGWALSLTLLIKYSVLALYGLAASVIEIPTFAIIGSPTFALAWAATVTVLAALAAVGVWRTWLTGRYRLERWTTFAFVCVFLGYSTALIVRSLQSGDWDALPLALVPAAVCVLPAVRYLSLVLHHRRSTEGTSS